MHGIGEDALPGMKRVGAFWRQGLVRFAARAGLGFLAGNFQQRQIVDGPGPGELNIVELIISAGGSGKLRKGHEDKNKMPKRGGNHRAARDAGFDPAILEEIAALKSLGSTRAANYRSYTARKALPEFAPAHLQLRRIPAKPCEQCSF